MTLPLLAGNVYQRTATQLAEKVIEKIAAHTRAVAPFAVGIDVAGRVLIDRPGRILPSEWVMTCTKRSDPDDLADEIRAEVARRDGPPARRLVVGAGRRAA